MTEKNEMKKYYEEMLAEKKKYYEAMTKCKLLELRLEKYREIDILLDEINGLHKTIKSKDNEIKLLNECVFSKNIDKLFLDTELKELKKIFNKISSNNIEIINLENELAIAKSNLKKNRGVK